MLCFSRFKKSLPPQGLGISVAAAVLAALVGISAGRALITSVAGSVSVVEGTSMSPSFQPGTSVYTVPISTPLARGDVVVLDDGHSGYALKRIVALPGDTLHLWRGYLFINRRMLREPYLPRHTYTAPDERSGAFIFHLGQDQYFVLGDNRACSIDSRTYGSVHRKQIKSRVSPAETRLRPEFANYALPARGKSLIRPL